MAKQGAQPSKKRKAAYLAIIGTLGLHVVCFAVFYIASAHKIKVDPELHVDVELLELPELLPPTPQEIAEQFAAKNVIANRNSRKSQEVRSYSRASDQRMQESVEEELRRFEQEAFDELEQARGDEPEREKLERKIINEDVYDYMENNASSFSNATVSYDLQDPERVHRNLPVPSYICKVSGTVVIDVQLDKLGAVSSASVNENATNTGNECLREQSLKYAQRSTFASQLDSKKMSGTITYTFVAQ